MDPIPEQSERPEPSLWLRAVLQVGLGLLLTAAAIPLMDTGTRVGMALTGPRSGALGELAARGCLLLVSAIGGFFAVRLSSTLARKPWDGLWACLVGSLGGGWQLWPLAATLHWDSLTLLSWPLGLFLGSVITAAAMSRRKSPPV